jgi:hypothetical protein
MNYEKKKKQRKLEWPMNYKSPKMNNPEKNSGNHLPHCLLHRNDHKISVNAVQLCHSPLPTAPPPSPSPSTLPSETPIMPSSPITVSQTVGAMVPQQSFPLTAPETIKPMSPDSSVASSKPASFESANSEPAVSSLQTLGWRT